MIDIIEAGKFYLECLKKVKEATLKENILPENTVLKVRADLMQYGGRMDKTLVCAFELNNIDYTFEIGVTRTDSVRDIAHNISLKIGSIISEVVFNRIDWSEIRETNQA